MSTTISMFLSILCQLFLTISYAREALTTQEGTYCRVKCSIAATVYLFFALLMTWFLFINPIKL